MARSREATAERKKVCRSLKQGAGRPFNIHEAFEEAPKENESTQSRQKSDVPALAPFNQAVRKEQERQRDDNAQKPNGCSAADKPTEKCQYPPHFGWEVHILFTFVSIFPFPVDWFLP